MEPKLNTLIMDYRRFCINLKDNLAILSTRKQGIKHRRNLRYNRVQGCNYSLSNRKNALLEIPNKTALQP